MKKISFIFIFFFALLFSCYSDIKLSIEPVFSTTFGKYGEYVYSTSDKSILSYLEWQQLPLCKMGINSSLTLNNLSLFTSFSYGLPSKCGKMYDSDWNEYGLKTTYSISNNYAKRNYDFSFGLTYKINLKYLTIIPEINYKYFYDFFQSNDGEGWYGRDIYSKTGKTVSWDSPDARHYRKLSRIELKRECKYFFVGMNFAGTLFSKLDIEIGTFIAPYSYIYNSDFHLDDNGTNREFYLTSEQECNFSRFLEKVYMDYKINNFVSISLSGDFIFGDIVKGILKGYEQNAGTDVYQLIIKSGIIFNF